MIEVDGFKAFRGVMRIYTFDGGVEVFGDWLYKPDSGCWYGNGHSYPENICDVVKVDYRRMDPLRCICGRKPCEVMDRGGLLLSCPDPENCSGNFYTAKHRSRVDCVNEWNDLIRAQRGK